MKLKKEEALEIIWGDSDNFKVVEEIFLSQSRWSTWTRFIVKEKKTGNFYRYDLEKGSTEYQDVPYEDVFKFTRVYPKEKVIVVYEEKP